ncbi:Ku protein [Curtobacterium flaccumfaciens]|uniref:non-homologous end joining protein Ku n=1 Tax=Curtobacterium flaccumfaciens TaxID=2035 RepID=UPI000FFEF6DC|nr:Ku protein [Curtobacterium flaccumfaciens]MCS0646724.1 Ku protein [Curtobacterium flaccumfaciens pv. flaccumfaciens]MCS6524319.1 Ku protein [Curtobacterium flaccumfaciens pv. flaccumfaciens]NUU10915.1 Ku protein [Curtobacterium flaccumfaciens]RXF84417.1 Ku protein [Curtobacterium flaccumfaciens pv. flaccumfaciens]
MRSIWKGSIAFGLVNVPIKVYAATETHDVSLHQVHDDDKGRIRYKRVCEFGHEVEYADIQRAYDDGDKTVVLTADDFKQLPEEQSHEVEVLEFVPVEQVDPMMFEKTYYLEPDSRSPKAYVLLRETLAKTDRLAIVQFTLRQKTRLGVLRVHDEVILLQGLLWGDEVRAADFKTLDTTVKVSANELKMSSSLVESMSTDFDPDRYTDSYQEELQQLIDAKLEAGDDIDTEKTFGAQDDEDDDEGGDVLDLMAALRASVDKKRTGGSGSRSSSTSRSSSGSGSGTSGSGTSSSGRKAPAKKAPAKKAAESTTEKATAKSAPKKAPAKKAPAKKPAAKKQAS